MASYTEKQKQELINTICEEMAKGRSLRSVLRDKGMPGRTAFYKWIDGNKEREGQYVCARDDRAETIFEDILDIADSQEGDVITLEDGKEVTNHDFIQRARLRIDSRKWILSKMQPKKYGDKLDLEVNNTNPTIQVINTSKQFDENGKSIKKGKK